jgi:DNA adenine methylase
LRYPGGKSRALRQIAPLFPENVREFREPFIGGGSVLLAAKSLFKDQCQTYWMNDLNYDLYCFWRWVRDDIDGLVSAVIAAKQRFPNGRELYERLTETGTGYTEFERAVRFFVMNRITFSGVVDSGGYSQQAFEKRFTDSSIERLRAVAPYLTGVEVTHGDYEPLLYRPGDDVFIFLDPPYWSATESRLYGVNGDLHLAFDHARFAENMRRCPHRWLITYDDSPQIRALFSFAEIIEWELQYGMNNYKQGQAAKGRELFIKNY